MFGFGRKEPKKEVKYNQEEVVKQGMLTKEGSSWQKRFFVLTVDGEIKYFADPNNLGGSLKGSFNVKNATYSPVSGSEKKKKDNCFSITLPEGRTYYLAADAAEEMSSWLAALVSAGAKKLNENVVKEGLLEKEGNGWHTRHFVLTAEKELKYYKGTELKGTIPLEYTYVSVWTDKKKSNCFRIKTSQREYFLHASSVGEMKDWIAAFASLGVVCKDPEETASSNFIHEGYLHKEGKSSVWRSRYFMLTPSGDLLYFTKKGGKLKGELKVDSSVDICIVPEKKDNCFMLSSPKKNYFLLADTAEAMKEWIEKLLSQGASQTKLFSEADIVKQGYLARQSNMLNIWEDSYFVLTKEGMVYFFTKRDGVKQGSFSLQHTSVSYARNKTRANCFIIEQPITHKNIVLGAQTPEDLQCWMDALELFGSERKTDFESVDVLKEGLLMKEGKKWQSRYFVLTKSKELHYFVKKGGVLKGTIHIEGTVIHPNEQKCRGCFTVEARGNDEKPKNKVYQLLANSTAQMCEWIQILGQNGATLKDFDEKDFVIVKSGPLKKRGSNNKGLKKRLFELTESKKLKYYDHDELKGCIQIENLIVRNHKDSFFQVESPERKYIFQAADVLGASGWIKALISQGALEMPFDPDIHRSKSFRNTILSRPTIMNNPHHSEATRQEESVDEKTRVYGVPLEVLLQRDSETLLIPKIVDQLIQEIEKFGLDEEGIFRVPGSNEDIKRIKKLFNSGAEVELPPNIHTVAALLKLYIKELPSPLMTHETYDDLVRLPDNTDESERVMELRNIIETRLPAPNRNLLEKLMQLFRKIVANSAINKMTPTNMAVVFAMNIMAPAEMDPIKMLAGNKPICQIFVDIIKNYSTVFGREGELHAEALQPNANNNNDDNE